ncbi:hypothetical protein ACFONL_02610 [Camelimonas fluminis]|uniref:Uncharacterized protein n=1 Tax=Camelimonas fluminis TaxID=1576911 RepID=A0ABV7UCL1_9HYPH|nr:hypothetical protein [Camelimonas fluminis]
MIVRPGRDPGVAQTTRNPPLFAAGFWFVNAGVAAAQAFPVKPVYRKRSMSLIWRIFSRKVGVNLPESAIVDEFNLCIHRHIMRWAKVKFINSITKSTSC